MSDTAKDIRLAPSDRASNMRTYTLIMLMIAYVFNFVDRQILAILLEPIRQDLHFSDSALGFLTGFGFALFYVTLGIPLARWADRGNRRDIVALSLAVWSGMTAITGFVQSFWQLAAARIGVGVGEAGCSPAAHSMIASLYPQKERSAAMAVYALGVPLGVLVGFLVGGWANELFGWRVAFFTVGVPGIILAVLIRLTVSEPPRQVNAQAEPPLKKASLSAVIRHLASMPSFVHLAIGGSLAAFVGYAILSWMPSFLMRTHDMSTGDIGVTLGLIMGIAGGLGIMAGGRLADLLGKDDARWYLWIVAIAISLAFPFYFGVYFWPNAGGALWFLVIPVALGNFYQATTFAQTQSLAPVEMRATAAAILLFILNVVGLGLGPQAVGIVSDLLRPRFGEDSLRYSLLIFSSVAVWSAYHYYRAGKFLPADLARMSEDVSAGGAPGTG
ncbi:MAG: MFS transporter [Parvularculaceae bacterium]